MQELRKKSVEELMSFGKNHSVQSWIDKMMQQQKHHLSKAFLIAILILEGVCQSARILDDVDLDLQLVVDLQESTTTTNSPWRMHTLFSVECDVYFDWQTVGMMHSFTKSRQPGAITRLLSCTDQQLASYRGLHLAPSHLVPSMSQHPVTGDWYPAINKPAAVVHWLHHSKDADIVDWVLILDADQIIRHPLTPWALGAEKGRPVAAQYGYLIGCDNELARIHTKHPELCDKVGGFILMHIDDLHVFAPLWLSKTEEVRADKQHWSTNITGDIFGQGWISEMYGYSFGAAEVGLQHKIDDHTMIYPGYIPAPDHEPHLMHYGLPFNVSDWKFDKLQHRDDSIVYDCNRLFPEPPYPSEARQLEPDPNEQRGILLSIECVNTLNEALLIHHQKSGCPEPHESDYLTFLKDSIHRILAPLGLNIPDTLLPLPEQNPTIHTLFSTECTNYFDWQTVGLMHSFRLSGQPGGITRLLSCTDKDLENYRGMNLAPTHVVPSMSLHPLTGDWYPAINKPAAILHWLSHVQTDAEYIVILDADMLLRGSITPWEFGAKRGLAVSAPYDYLIGCDNILAKIHTRNPEECDKVGGVLMMHIDDLRLLAPYWLHKTEEVRSDKAHWSTNITGDIYGEGWISEMYGYSFGAAEIKLRHLKRSDIMMYPGSSVPSFSPRVLHYGLKFEVGNWHFDKAEWREQDMTNTCWQYFPNPPDELSLFSEPLERAQHNISIGCVKTLNEALHLHHIECGCIPQQAFKNPQNELDINMQGRTQPDDHKEDQKRLTQKIVSDQSLDKDPRLQTKTATMDQDLDKSEAILGSIRGNSNLNYHAKQVLKRKTDLLESEVWSSSSSSIPTILMTPMYWKVVIWSLLVSLFLLIISTLFSRRNHTSQLKQQKRRENNNNNNNPLKKYPIGSSSSLYTQRPANTRPATNSSIEISGGQYQGVLLPREGDDNIV